MNFISASTRIRLAALRPRGGFAWLSLFATVLLALELGAALWLLCFHQWQVLRFPYPLDYGEGPLLGHVMRLASAENPYPADLSTPPFQVLVYPPLFPLLQLPFAWLLGPALWYGRMLSVLGMLAAAVSCGLILRSLTRDRVAALCGGALLLASPYVVYWSALARVDSLALGLSLSGLCVVICGSARRRDLVVAALLFVAAIYTRQSAGFAAPFAAFVWLLHERAVPKALELAGLTGALAALLLVSLDLATGGGFWLGIVSANNTSFSWGTVQDSLRQTFWLMPLLVVGAAAYLLAGAWRRDRVWWGLVPYLLGGCAAALTVGKSGSNVNYLLEAVAGSSLVAAGWIASTRGRPLLRALAMLCLAVQVHFMLAASRDDYGRQEMWKLEREAEISALSELVAREDGPVLADEFMALLPLAGKQIAFHPFEFMQLERVGLWDETPMVEALLAGKFPLILLYQAEDWPSIRLRWSPALVEAIESRYGVEQQLARTLVLRPLTDPPPSRGHGGGQRVR